VTFVSGMSYTIAIDVGGTCTDCAAVDSSGRFTLAKTFSTPPDFSAGIMDGLGSLAAASSEDLEGLLSSTTLFLHSTTIVENSIVDGRMAPAALITTRGFEDTLRAMRGGYGRWSGLTETEKRDPIRTSKPPELIPRRLIRGVEERAGSTGERSVIPNEREITSAIAGLLEEGVESIGICLLWSFLAPDAEKRVEEIIERLRPGLFVTSSHRIAPALGEYERTSTTALNARLGPVVAEYIAGLQRDLRDRGFAGRFLVMQAYGGLLPAPEASARPIGMIESGPVGGLLGAKRVGESMGKRNVIAADMGGTTFKVGVVRDGLIEYERDSLVFRYHYAVPKLDIASLGLAGGSIVSVDPATGGPSIGPRSAGSYPGPVCYGHGGEEPTVTDVDAVLGYLHPDLFLGGKKSLDIEAARRAFDKNVAHPLGMTIEEAAPRIYRLANSLFFDKLHKTTVQRGLDPRLFAFVSIGGTAGMHVTSYAAMLGVERVIIPRTASVHGAAGLIYSDVVHEEQVTRPCRLPIPAEEIASIFEDLETKIRRLLHEDGFDGHAIHLVRSIDMRYAQQTNIVTVPVEGPYPFDEPLLTKTVDRFEELYRERYGRESGYREAGIELVSFRLRGIGEVAKPAIAPLEAGDVDPKDALLERRRAWVDDLAEFQEVDGYSFERLKPGNLIRGPAIVWTPTTTIVLRSADSARFDERANLILIPSALVGAERSEERV
jgi:N-methylhydantoinase A